MAAGRGGTGQRSARGQVGCRRRRRRRPGGTSPGDPGAAQRLRIRFRKYLFKGILVAEHWIQWTGPETDFKAGSSNDNSSAFDSPSVDLYQTDLYLYNLLKQLVSMDSKLQSQMFDKI